ncbi:MAG: 6-carboxytetrahydropterin synthase [Nitrospira sp.]|nr:6-carboxytetrahydropterin synthase [Nitrospira sp.]
MTQASVTRRYRFCAAHRLHTDHLSSEENWAAFGKCNNPNGHGHNYIVLVTVKSSAVGGGVDLARMDRIVSDHVVTRFDHHDLNQDPEFVDCTTTGENLVLLIWDLLVTHFPAGQLVKVGLIETRDNYFEYAGAARQAPVLREGQHG